MKQVYLGGNDFWLRVGLMDDDGNPALGLTVTAWLSLTKAGATIHADVSKVLIEGATVDGLRIYEAQVSAASLTTHITAHAGKVIYARYQTTNYDAHEELEVVAARRVGL